MDWGREPGDADLWRAREAGTSRAVVSGGAFGSPEADGASEVTLDATFGAAEEKIEREEAPQARDGADAGKADAGKVGARRVSFVTDTDASEIVPASPALEAADVAPGAWLRTQPPPEKAPGQAGSPLASALRQSRDGAGDGPHGAHPRLADLLASGGGGGGGGGIGGGGGGIFSSALRFAKQGTFKQTQMRDDPRGAPSCPVPRAAAALGRALPGAVLSPLQRPLVSHSLK